MAKLLDSNLIAGEKSGYRIESDKNRTTESENNTVRSVIGKTTSTVSHSETHTEYADGASTVDAVTYRASYESGGYSVSVEQNDKVVQNTAGILQKNEDSATVEKTNKVREVLDNADYEAIIIDKQKTVSAETSLWSMEAVTETENGYTRHEVSILDAEAHATAGVYVGSEGFKASINAGASVSAIETSGTVVYGDTSFEGEASLFNTEAHISAGVKVDSDGITASVGTGASVTVAKVSGSAKVGDGNLGLELGGDVEVLSASVDASAKIGYSKNEKTGEYEVNAYVSAEVNAVLAEGNVSATFSIAGIDVGTKVGVYIGAGARVKIGLEDNKFVFDISAALGIGFNLKFTIGFNDEFIKNIRFLIDYSGIKYVADNPYFKVDTEKLRTYAMRIDSVNNRLRQLDGDLRSLYWQVGFLDLWDIMIANLLTSGSSTLTQVKSYLDNSASRFETADSKAREYVGG